MDGHLSTIHILKNISSRFSRKFEEFASDILKYPEEMFSRYYIHSDKHVLNFQPQNCDLAGDEGLYITT